MGAVLRFGILLVACGLPALASESLEGRAKCNRDNLLRCYDPTGTKPTDVASRSAATAFCSSYLSIPVVTSVRATVTPVTYVPLRYAGALDDGAAYSQNSRTVTSATTTTDTTEVVTLVSTSVSTLEVTVVTTVPAPPVARRDAVAPVAGPACASSSRSPSSLSSACSCLSITPSTTYITATAATSTDVILSTVHDTATTTTATTTTETSTSTFTSTSTSTSSSPSTSTTSSPTVPPPSLQTCAFGVAFGYQQPVGAVQKSFTLNTQSGAGCNRWGWYETPTVAELQGGLSGPLYVGAGGNDISRAINVGLWVATANALGRVTVTYLLDPPYTLAQVHVNLACLPLTRCAPGQYTYNAGSIPNLPTWSNPSPLVYPTCSGGSRAALVIEASVNILTVASTCPPPKAT